MLSNGNAAAALPHTLKLVSSCTPASAGRAWQSAPHPTLPLLATACADKTVRIYSLTSFTLLSTITGGHKRSVRCCAWKPGVPPPSGPTGDSILATGSFDASAAIWVGSPGGAQDNDASGDGNEDDEDFRFAVVLEGHDSEIKSIAWSAYGNFLATCGRDKSVWIWEALEPGAGFGGGLNGADDEDNYETVAVLQEHDGDVKCVAWHPTEEQCLASASYDDHVRIWREDIDGEWGCVGVCEGHKGTVWAVAWEPAAEPGTRETDGDATNGNGEPEAVSGARLVSCSDDKTVRIWRRAPKPPRQQKPDQPRLSVIRSTADNEEWAQEGALPAVHDRAVYAVAWSAASRRIATCGSDGRIGVYEEGDAGGSAWRVLAVVDAAHGVYEVNHVCWAPRADASKAGGDEVIVSTGDDGEVKIWALT